MDASIILQLQKHDGTTTQHKRTFNVDSEPAMFYKPVIMLGGEPIYGKNIDTYKTLNDFSIDWVCKFVVNGTQYTQITTYLGNNGWSTVTNWYE